MSGVRTKGQFTGKHMLAVMVVGFGIVVAVNFYMASLAIGGFHGTVVDNSYVASQKFNDWMHEAEADKALGWQVTSERAGDGFVTVATTGVPVGAELTAILRRPWARRNGLHLNSCNRPMVSSARPK